jgi:hypothetical protein
LGFVARPYRTRQSTKHFYQNHNQPFSLATTSSTDRVPEAHGGPGPPWAVLPWAVLPNTPFYQIAGPRPLPFYLQENLDRWVVWITKPNTTTIKTQAPKMVAEDDGQAFWNRTVQDADYTKTNSTTTRRQGREPSSCRHASARKPSRRSLREISVRMVIFSMPLSINGQQRAQWGSIGRSVSI